MDENRLYEKLEQVDHKVDKLLQWKSAVDERCRAHRGLTDEMHRTLYSNPSGLEQEVARLVNCKTNISRWRDFFLFILKIVIASSIIGITAWLLQMYRSI